MEDEGLKARYIETDLNPDWLSQSNWQRSDAVEVRTYWNSKPAPPSLWFSARLLWSDKYLYVRFEATRSDEMIVNSEPKLDEKAIGLWERDVCEIFLAPGRNDPGRYFEFEVSPTGEWLDLAIDSTSGERITDWDYRSGIEAAACIEEDRVVMAIRVPWKAFGIAPQAGDVWLGNIFRCTGKDPGRGYLAWKPTMTAAPNFHLPERFGQLIFDN